MTLEDILNHEPDGVDSEMIVVLANEVLQLRNALYNVSDKPQQQTSGGRCRKCKSFTTYARQDSAAGLCMKCELEAKP